MGKIERSDKFESNVVQKSFFEEISLRWLGILFQDNGRNKKENALKTILMRTGFRGCRSVVEYILTRTGFRGCRSEVEYILTRTGLFQRLQECSRIYIDEDGFIVEAAVV